MASALFTLEETIFFHTTAVPESSSMVWRQFFRRRMSSRWFPWFQLIRGMGAHLCEDHILATPIIKEVCAEKGGDKEKGKWGTRYYE